MNRTQVHLSGGGPVASHYAGVEGGTRWRTVLKTLRAGRTASRPERAQGQALVEFALILSVTLLLTVGILDVARLFAAQISLTNGVREAALYAGEGAYTRWCAPPPSPGSIPCPTDPDFDPVVNTAADPQNVAFHIRGEAAVMDVTQIVMSKPVCDNAPGTACSSDSTYVRITATYPFRPLTPIISVILGDPIQLGASTSARVQR
jgi:TadE-like protein